MAVETVVLWPDYIDTASSDNLHVVKNIDNLKVHSYSSYYVGIEGGCCSNSSINFNFESLPADAANIVEVRLKHQFYKDSSGYNVQDSEGGWLDPNDWNNYIGIYIYHFCGGSSSTHPGDVWETVFHPDGTFETYKNGSFLGDEGVYRGGWYDNIFDVDQWKSGKRVAMSFSRPSYDWETAYLRYVVAEVDYEPYKTFIKDSGVWKNSTVYIKDSSTWKESEVYVNDSGTWK